eukprot:4866040-Prymnesium_polylepis.1
MAIFRATIACWWVTDAVARWCLAMEGHTPFQSATLLLGARRRPRSGRSGSRVGVEGRGRVLGVSGHP